MELIQDKEHAVMIPSEDVHLGGILTIPNDAVGLVLFVHGSGSSRLSVRNQHVAHFLNHHKLATLLFDLLTVAEEEYDARTRELRFDIGLLAKRLIDTTTWCMQHLANHQLKIGYFGASTGAAAALIAAAKLPQIKAVVSRGGRPDLAESLLPQVTAPTLLLVGEQDPPVITLNQQAFDALTCIKKLQIIPRATHLFEEPGTLDEVAYAAKNWFAEYLVN